MWYAFENFSGVTVLDELEIGDYEKNQGSWFVRYLLASRIRNMPGLTTKFKQNNGKVDITLSR